MQHAVVARAAIAAAMATALSFPPAVEASYPGRDGLIAFTRSVGPKPGQVYIVRPNGHGLRRFTHRRGGAGAAAWSPDGRRTAFTAAGRRSPVHVFVKRLGGGVRQITHGEAAYDDPTWSPDGRRIAAVRGHWARDGQYYESLVVMRANGSRKRVVHRGDVLGSSHPAWSPDGRWIAFTHTDIDLQGADPNIWIVPSGGGAARVINRPGSQDDPDWSPDGRLIAYTYGFGLGPDDIRVIRPDGTGDRPVSDDLDVPDGMPGWAPSGRRLAISRLGRIWTIAPDGTGLRQLTHARAIVSDWDLSWQPR
jgi:Tol biopolymer transport system component